MRGENPKVRTRNSMWRVVGEICVTRGFDRRRVASRLQCQRVLEACLDHVRFPPAFFGKTKFVRARPPLLETGIFDVVVTHGRWHNTRFQSENRLENISNHVLRIKADSVVRDYVKSNKGSETRRSKPRRRDRLVMEKKK
jgi:hypothetical protein